MISGNKSGKMKGLGEPATKQNANFVSHKIFLGSEIDQGWSDPSKTLSPGSWNGTQRSLS